MNPHVSAYDRQKIHDIKHTQMHWHCVMCDARGCMIQSSRLLTLGSAPHQMSHKLYTCVRVCVVRVRARHREREREKGERKRQRAKEIDTYARTQIGKNKRMYTYRHIYTSRYIQHAAYAHTHIHAPVHVCINACADNTNRHKSTNKRTMHMHACIDKHGTMHVCIYIPHMHRKQTIHTRITLRKSERRIICEQNWNHCRHACSDGTYRHVHKSVCINA